MKTLSRILKRYFTTVVFSATLLAAVGTGCSSKETKAAKHLERANRYFDAKDYDKAEIEYRNVLNNSQSDRSAIRQLGFIYYEQGKLPQAFALLQKAKELEPDNLDVRQKLGAFHLVGRKFEEARKEAEFIIAKQPSNEEALILLSNATATRQEIEEAFKRLENLRSQSENKAGFHLALGTLHFRTNGLTQAEAAFRKALALNPKSGGAHIALGHLAFLQNDRPQAEQFFAKAASLAAPRSPDGMQIVDFKIRTGDLEAAKKLLEGVLDRAKDYLPARARLADIAFAEKKYEECEALIKQVLSRDEANFDAHMLSGRVKMVQGKATEAITQFERLNTVYPRVPQTHFQLGVAYLLAQDQAKAVTSLQQSLALNPGFTEASLLLAELNIRRGDPGSAISAMNQLISQRRGYPQANLVLANAYRARNNLPEAAAIYQKLTEAMPKNAQMPLMLGQVLRQQNKNLEARQAFERARQLGPDSFAPVEQLVSLDISEKQYPAAMQRVREQIAVTPKAPEPLFLLAQVYLAQTNFPEAEVTLIKALELNPDFLPAAMGLAKLYVDSKKHQQGLDRLQAILTKDPKRLDARMLVGMIHGEMKDYEAARSAYEMLLEIDPKYVAALNNLAYLYTERLGQLDKAYELARRALDLRPDDPAMADTLGWILYKRGEYSRALTILTKSADKLPTEPEALFHLGMTHYMLVEEEPARIALERALQLNKDFPGKSEVAELLAVLSIDPKTADAKVLTDLEKQLTQRPGDPVLLAKVAAIYQRQGSVGKAVQTYEQALKVNSNNVPVLVRLAELYHGPLKNTAKAMERAKAARALAPDDAHIGLILGRLAHQAGDDQWAASLLQVSVSKLPGQPDALHDLAWCYYNIGRLREAETTMQGALQAGDGPFSKAEEARLFLTIHSLASDQGKLRAAATQINDLLRTNANYLPAQAAAALLHQQQGNFQAARQSYEAILTRYPLFTPANKHLAAIYLQQNTELQKAFDYGVKARTAYPEDSEVARTLGIISYRRGDYRRAIDLLAESSRKRPNDAELFYNLGLAHHQLKQVAPTKEAMNKAVALNGTATFAEDAKKILAELK
jgi:tetratricopeptide (TPR) repeat protein